MPWPRWRDEWREKMKMNWKGFYSFRYPFVRSFQSIFIFSRHSSLRRGQGIWRTNLEGIVLRKDTSTTSEDFSKKKSEWRNKNRNTGEYIKVIQSKIYIDDSRSSWRSCCCTPSVRLINLADMNCHVPYQCRSAETMTHGGWMCLLFVLHVWAFASTMTMVLTNPNQ